MQEQRNGAKHTHISYGPPSIWSSGNTTPPAPPEPSIVTSRRETPISRALPFHRPAVIDILDWGDGSESGALVWEWSCYEAGAGGGAEKLV